MNHNNMHGKHRQSRPNASQRWVQKITPPLSDLFKHTRSRTISIALIALAVILGFVSQPIGLTLVVIYGVISIVRKIPSRTTFLAALISLAIVPIAIIAEWTITAQNLGAYSFLLFVIATVSLCSELVREAKILQNQK